MEQVESNINPTRELAAIMFSDVVGYTAIMGRDEQKGVQAIADHRERLRSLLPRFNGRVIGEIGDGTLTSFHSVLDAIGCARELQANLKDDRELRLRIGIHLGDVLLTNNTVLGDGVNVASRIHALAPPGGICVSEHVYDEIRNKPGMVARNLGKKNLKNVSRPIRVYALQVVGEDLSTGSKLGKRVAIGAIISALIVAIVAAYVYRAQIRTVMPLRAPVANGGQATVAVLPLSNLSADKNDEYFSDGMTDEIIGQLSKITGIQVAARTSSFVFKGKSEDAAKIASLLHVHNLLEGSVQRSAGNLRIEVQLIDASNGFTLWSERYDEKMADVFQIQTDVAESVAQSLRVKLLPAVRARLDKRPTENLEAYNLSLQGRYYVRQFTGQSAGKAIQYYSRAIEKDPEFAQAYQGLGDAYSNASSWTIAPRDAMPRAKSYYEKALQLDETLAEAHAGLALWALFWFDWDFPGAEREFKRAIALDPNSSVAHLDYGWFLAYMGRLEDALPELQRARDLDPLSPEAVIQIGYAYSNRRQYARADEYFLQAIAMAPDYYESYYARGLNLVCQGKKADAVPVSEKAAALVEADFPPTQSALAAIYAATGRRAEALKILDYLKDLSTHQYVDAIAFAGIYYALGEKDVASKWLEKAYADRSGYLMSLKMPFWDPVRSDPRFQAIYKKVGLPP
jgi:TolB-like protein/class 3 adenylate cyclase/Flp pilus assembly protein TadD